METDKPILSKADAQSYDAMAHCSSCKHSQSVSASITQKRVRRSNSCPSNEIKQIGSPTVKQVTMVKRWHSLQALHLNSHDNKVHDRLDTSPLIITNSKAQAPVWAPFNKADVSQARSLTKRVLSLFALGVALAVVLNFLQRQKRVTVFAPGVFGDVLNSAWWIPPTFGLAAIVIGLLYPKIDEILGNADKMKPEWSNVMRCIALFVGINHASAKIPFDSNIHLSLTLALLSVGLWYFFDQSVSGFGLGIAVTGVATAVTQLLVAMNVFGYSDPDFLYMQSWVPCLFFSGGVTVGTVGRALATFEEVPAVKLHME